MKLLYPVINPVTSLFCLLIWAHSVHAESCFLDAQSYYEQIYCEVKSKGKGRLLPTFIDFRKNNEMTQALLLKRDALALRLDFKMPKRDASDQRTYEVSATPSIDLKPNQKQREYKSEHSTSPGCNLEDLSIHCGPEEFTLLGNLNNQKLSSMALTSKNRLELDAFQGRNSDAHEYGLYLTQSYIQYLEAMRSIGLAGVTMPYSRFHYLFHDLNAKGVDARARFGKMFEYLKQDKARNAISEQINLPSELSLNDCSRLGRNLFACEHGKRNYLFSRDGA